MKHGILIGLTVMVLVAAACTAGRLPSAGAANTPVVTVPQTELATSEPASTDAPAFETFWWRVWEKAQLGEYTLLCDLDLDGTQDLISYTYDTDEEGCTLSVNDATAHIDTHTLGSIVLHDFDPDDGRIDMIVSGDVASDDFFTYFLRYDGTTLSLLCEESGDLQMLGQDDSRTSVSLLQQADVLGTWGGARSYTFRNGALTADDSVWKNVMAFDEEYCLTVTRELPVTVDNAQTTLPAGTRLMPIVMAVDRSYATMQTQDGRIATIRFTFQDDQWEPLIAGSPESNYFDAIPYAG